MDVARVVVVVAVAIVSSIAPKQRARHGERGGRVVRAVVDHDPAPDEPTERRRRRGGRGGGHGHLPPTVPSRVRICILLKTKTKQKDSCRSDGKAVSYLGRIT